MKTTKIIHVLKMVTLIRIGEPFNTKVTVYLSADIYAKIPFHQVINVICIDLTTSVVRIKRPYVYYKSRVTDLLFLPD